jgi:AraC-like DNA-binding protein
MPLGTLAEIACLSQYHFVRVFRSVTGIPPGEFLAALRLDRAKRLLLTTDLSVIEVCYEVGYESLGTFTTRFTRLVGIPPGRLRRLPEELGPVLTAAHEREVALPPLAACHTSVIGRIHAPDFAGGPIYVGLFPSAIAQARPVTGVLLPAPGAYRLSAVPDGSYKLLAAALPAARDLVEYLLPGGALRVASAPDLLTVRAGRVHGTTDLVLRPPRAIDPPILVALPALLLESLAAD